MEMREHLGEVVQAQQAVLERVASAWPVGTVVERDGDVIRPRSLVG